MIDIKAFWGAVLSQDEKAIAVYFAENAYVNWHNTNEHFTAAEFIRANCEYPGKWDGKVERIHISGDVIITATHVYEKDTALSFHVTSFITTKNDKITSIDEYWGDDGPPPAWRTEMGIGRALRQ